MDISISDLLFRFLSISTSQCYNAMLNSAMAEEASQRTAAPVHLSGKPMTIRVLEVVRQELPNGQHRPFTHPVSIQ